MTINQKRCKNLIKEFLLEVSKELKKRGYALSEVFYRDWLALIETFPFGIGVVSSKIDENSQAYGYSFSGGDIFFDIDFIDKIPEKENVILEIKDDMVLNGKHEVQYTKIRSKSEIIYEDYTIEIIPFYTDKTEFLLIDGNHRLNQAMRDSKITIKAWVSSDFFVLNSIRPMEQMITYGINQSFGFICNHLNLVSKSELAKKPNFYISRIKEILIMREKATNNQGMSLY